MMVCIFMNIHELIRVGKASSLPELGGNVSQKNKLIYHVGVHTQTIKLLGPS